jgi:hypothetical protein
MKIVRISKVWSVSSGKQEYIFVAYIFNEFTNKIYRMEIDDKVKDTDLKLDSTMKSNFMEQEMLI